MNKSIGPNRSTTKPPSMEGGLWLMEGNCKIFRNLLIVATNYVIMTIIPSEGKDAGVLSFVICSQNGDGVNARDICSAY